MVRCELCRQHEAAPNERLCYRCENEYIDTLPTKDDKEEE